MSLIGLLFFTLPLVQAQTSPTNAAPVVVPAPNRAYPVVMPPPVTNAPSNPVVPTPAITNAPADESSPIPTAPPLTPAPLAAQPLPQIIPHAGPTNAAPGPDEIYDIRPPIFFLRSWFWLWITLATLATIALLAFLWHLFKPNRQLSAKTAYELTLEKLEKARSMMREDNAMPYTVFLSEIIRTYLGQRFQAPSTRRTTEEFFQMMEADPTTPLAAHRLLLLDFLKRCDVIKFAPYQPNLAELDFVYQHAVTFVKATEPVPEHLNGRHP